MSWKNEGTHAFLMMSLGLHATMIREVCVSKTHLACNMTAPGQ